MGVKMDLYDKYYKMFKDTIEEKKKNEEFDYVVKDYIWITMKFLEDRNIEPWETDKMMDLVSELLETNNNKMLETIERTIKEVLNRK